MKQFFATIVLCFGLLQASAKDGYKIHLKYTDIHDSMVYLTHYFAKPLPNIYKIDSAHINSKGEAVLTRQTKLVGGIYMLLLADRKTYFEFLLDNGDDIGITATASDLPTSLKFKNSPLNDEFKSYQTFLATFGKKQQVFMKELAQAKNADDSLTINKKIAEQGKELTVYRRSYEKDHPNTLLGNIFSALEVPEVPPGKHYLPGGVEDTFFVYHYYKGHYWDGFNFKDDRLIHAPILDAKLEEYINKLTIPVPDSVIKESNMLLAKARGSENLFKYTLNWLSTNAQTSKVMGMDRVFLYLVDEYYAKGDANWLDSATLAKYYDRAMKIRPNIIGNLAPPLVMKDLGGKDNSLYDVKAKYTLVVFWSPDCGHCQHEIPLIDSVYRAVLKDKGVKIYAAITENEEAKWHAFIKKFHLEEWTHVWDPEATSRYWALYDVNVTPSIYLLDEKKNIRGKKLDHTNIMQVIEMVERADKSAKQ
jgi:thiol-disulfide isomerase/thioredoxin